MMSRYCLTISLLLTLASVATAAIDAEAIIAAAAPADEFADADLVVLYRAETVDVDDTGRVTRRIHTLHRLQTHWSVRNRSDVRVAWDRYRQELEVVTARTFTPNGTVVSTPENGFNEVTPGAVARAAVFMNWREMVISLVGTEPGCVVELEYLVRDLAPGPLPASGVAWFGDEYPVLESHFSGRGVATELVAAGGAAITDPDPDTWVARDLTPYPTEGAGRWRHRFVPHVIWSRLNDPAGVATAVRKTSDGAAGATTGLTTWLTETRADRDVMTDEDLVGRIAALAHDGIAGVHLPGGLWNTAPRLAEDVYATAVGTDWERALVALTLLREAGWQPELALFGREKPQSGHPQAVGDFLRLRIVVRVGDQNWWLAPDRADAWSGACDLAGWTGLFLSADGGQRLYTVPVKRGICRWSAHLSPAADEGWTATGDLILRGPYRPRDLDAHDLAETLATSLLPDGEVVDLEVRIDSPEELSLRLTVRGENLGDMDRDLLTRKLPWPENSVLADLPAGFHAEHPTRSAPLWIESPGLEQVSLRIELPENWTVDSPRPTNRRFATPRASFEQSTILEDGTLLLQRTIELTPGMVIPTDYPALRQLLSTALHSTRTPLTLIID